VAQDFSSSPRVGADREGPWKYPPELLEVLASFGLAPRGDSEPAMVRDALSDLYRYELRRLRDRLLAHQLVKGDYVDRVVALRKAYWPLTLMPHAWERICRAEHDPSAP
jgi:hypothetical protein